MASIVGEMFTRLEGQGCKARIVSAERRHDLQREMDELRRRGALDETFSGERLGWFDFNLSTDLPAQSLIVVAVPSYQSKAIFHWKKNPRTLVLPPTYVGYTETSTRIENELAMLLSAHGYRVARVQLPLKPLAVHSGLAVYGRNNICYVAGMGSFLQLVGAYSDLPHPGDVWQPMQMMERCQNCQACLHHCPAGAISSERFLLHAERCIVFHNERASQIPFPPWIDSAWHNCLEGCMRCQSVCPENIKVRDRVERTQEFSEEETRLILDGATLGQLAAATRYKLQQLDLVQDLAILPRNLGVFFR
jgi:epoxyqueuosine reductase